MQSGAKALAPTVKGISVAPLFIYKVTTLVLDQVSTHSKPSSLWYWSYAQSRTTMWKGLVTMILLGQSTN